MRLNMNRTISMTTRGAKALHLFIMVFLIIFLITGFIVDVSFFMRFLWISICVVFLYLLLVLLFTRIKITDEELIFYFFIKRRIKLIEIDFAKMEKEESFVCEHWFYIFLKNNKRYTMSTYQKCYFGLYLGCDAIKTVEVIQIIKDLAKQKQIEIKN